MSNGTELAVGYINLIPSARGFGAALLAQIGAPVEDASASAGKRAGAGLQSGLLNAVTGTGPKLATALGLAAVGALAIKSAVDVEDAQNIIIRSTGATGKAADGLQASFRNVASGTAASFDTVSTTLSQLYQRTGLQGKALEGLSSQVITFNRITKDSPITVDALTKSLAGFNVPGAEMGKVLDHLFVISQKTGVPLADLLGTLQTAGPIARQFGLSVEFTAGLLAQLNKAGLDANQILPGLRKVFVDAAKAGEDPQAALRRIISSLQDLVKQGDINGARNLAEQVFGPRGVGLVDAVLAGKLSLDDFNKTISTSGAGIVETGKKTETLSGALGILRNNAQLALAAFATPGVQAANEALRAVLPAVQSLGKEFAGLPDPIKLGLVAIVGLGFGIAKLGQIATNVGPGLVELGKTAETAFQLAAVRGLEIIDVFKGLSFAGAGTATGVGLATTALGSFALAGAGVALVSYGIVKALDLGENQFTQYQAAGRKAAQADVQSANTSGKAFEDLVARRKALLVQLDAIVKASFIAGGKTPGAPQTFDLDIFPKGMSGDFQKLRQEYVDTGKAVDDLRPKHQAMVEQQKLEADAAKVTAGALDQYTTATRNGTDASSALANLTADANTALSNLQGALLQAAGGEIGYERSLIARDKAQQAAAAASNGVLFAQNLLNQAVDEFGPTSQQARDAYGKVLLAQRDSTEAALNLRQANNDVAASSLALDDNQKNLFDTLGLGTKTTEQQISTVDAYIAKLKANQDANKDTGDSMNLPIFQAILLKQKLEDVPVGPQPPTTFTLDVQGWDQAVALARFVNSLPGNENVIFDPLAGLIGGVHAAGGIFTQPHVGLVAEAGPEAILPLDDPVKSWHLIAQSGLLGKISVPPNTGNDGNGLLIGEYHFHGEGPADPVRHGLETARNLRAARILVGL